MHINFLHIISFQKPLRLPNLPSISSSVAQRNAVKRPAAKPLEEVVKPKVAKAKIPDWDYKSRFNQLNEQHKGMQEKLHVMKIKCTGKYKLTVLVLGVFGNPHWIVQNSAIAFPSFNFRAMHSLYIVNFLKEEALICEIVTNTDGTSEFH